MGKALPLELNLQYRRHLRPSQFNVSFPIALPLVRVGRSVGQKKKKRERTLERAWVPGKAGLLSTKAWLQSQLENVVPSFDILYLQLRVLNLTFGLEDIIGW